MPSVHLSEGHKALCRVKVGDQLPELTLEASDGDRTSLVDHYGETLTVVFFWTADRYQARDQLRDMDPEILRPFSNRGVRVVGIVVGDPTPETKRWLSDSRVTFPNLLDRDQAAFAKVGSEKLPRTYLLDGKGKILWFDIEYSLARAGNCVRRFNSYWASRKCGGGQGTAAEPALRLSLRANVADVVQVEDHRLALSRE